MKSAIQLMYKSLVAMIMVSVLPLAGIEALAAPSSISVDPAGKRVLFKAAGYSQVEYKWPKSGVVCRHNQTKSLRTCPNLRPKEYYQIVDFADNRKATFYLPEAPDSVKPFTCRGSSSGNLTNVRYGLNTNNRYFITWNRRLSSSWIQLQYEGPGTRKIITQGTTASIKTLIQPNANYRLDDLTYGGTVYIALKINGC